MSGLSVNTNLNAIKAQRNIQDAAGSLNERLENLASAMKVNDASDDAAGLAISEGLRSQIRGTSQAIRNVQDGLSMAQTAEGASQEITDNLQRIRELSIQSSNGSLNNDQRELIQEEVDELKEQVNQIAEQADFNGKKLLDGSLDEQIQAGANSGESVNVSSGAQDTTTLGVDGTDVTTRENAEQSIEDSTNAINQVATDRASLGAQQNRLEGTVDFLEISRENQQASESRIRDADLAAETTGRATSSILTQSSTSVLAQANNLQGQQALQLLG